MEQARGIYLFRWPDTLSLESFAARAGGVGLSRNMEISSALFVLQSSMLTSLHFFFCTRQSVDQSRCKHTMTAFSET